MKKIKTVDAVGHVLPHDMTQIIRAVSKGVAFKKGHIIREEDIEKLLSMGKDHIFVVEAGENIIHEDDAALILADICMNDNMMKTGISEGKIEIIADCDGFFQVDRDRLNMINSIGDIMIATRTGNLPVKKGDKLAGMRIIPLMIDKEQMDKAVNIKGDKPIFTLTKNRKLKGGIVTTGNEVYYQRIKDTFTPVIVDKFNENKIDYISHEICYDDTEMIKEAIIKTKKSGADIIICTGGMSIDPDDLTPAAIKESGAEIVTYGTPVLPGAMFLIGYYEDGTTVIGLPGCAMYTKITVFDIILPYVLAGIKLTREHIAKLGYGGLCLNCKQCHYPNCEFGKGV